MPPTPSQHPRMLHERKQPISPIHWLALSVLTILLIIISTIIILPATRADMGNIQPHYNAAPPTFGAGGDTTVPNDIEARFVYGSLTLSPTALSAANITITLCGSSTLLNFNNPPISGNTLTWGYNFAVTGGTCYRFNNNLDPATANKISSYNYVDIVNSSFEGQPHANTTRLEMNTTRTTQNDIQNTTRTTQNDAQNATRTTQNDLQNTTINSKCDRGTNPDTACVGNHFNNDTMAPRDYTDATFCYRHGDDPSTTCYTTEFSNELYCSRNPFSGQDADHTCVGDHYHNSTSLHPPTGLRVSYMDRPTGEIALQWDPNSTRPEDLVVILINGVEFPPATPGVLFRYSNGAIPCSGVAEVWARNPDTGEESPREYVPYNCEKTVDNSDTQRIRGMSAQLIGPTVHIAWDSDVREGVEWEISGNSTTTLPDHWDSWSDWQYSPDYYCYLGNNQPSLCDPLTRTLDVPATDFDGETFLRGIYYSADATRATTVGCEVDYVPDGDLHACGTLAPPTGGGGGNTTDCTNGCTGNFTGNFTITTNDGFISGGNFDTLNHMADLLNTAIIILSPYLTLTIAWLIIAPRIGRSTTGLIMGLVLLVACFTVTLDKAYYDAATAPFFTEFLIASLGIMTLLQFWLSWDMHQNERLERRKQRATTPG